jgi:hypothetical protein
MQKAIKLLGAVILGGLLSATTLHADDLAALDGKWSMKRKTDDGQTATYQLHFKDGKFTFRLMSEGGSTLLYAEGTAKIASAGAVKVLMLSDLKAGPSDTEINPVEEKFDAPVRVAGGTLYLASGLDREREESPRLDVYRKE